MKLKNWMIAASIILVLFGLGFILIPATLTGWYDATLNDAGIYMTQLLGGAFIALAILNFVLRNTTDVTTQRAFAAATLIGNAVGVVFTLIALLNGVINPLGWTTFALYLVLGLGYGYFLLPK
jgi:hypothetical protein